MNGLHADRLSDEPEIPWGDEMISRKELAARNVGLAFLAVKKISQAWRNDPDLLLSATLYGLVLAARRWDPNRGIRFSTYAMRTIERRVSRCREEEEHTIRVPHWISMKKGREEAQVRLPAFVEAADRAHRCGSFQDDAKGLGEYEPPDRSDPPGSEEEREERDARLRWLHEAIDGLKPMQRLVVQMRLDGLSNVEISRQTGLTLGTVREYYHRSLLGLKEQL